MLAQLGPYLIDEELAEGGMARVFRARLRGLGGFEKTLVIKQIRPELAKDPRFVELFVREANTLVQLSHPHIVPVYELGAVDGTYYLSMEYVEGATVARMLEDGPLAPALVAHLGAQVCDALEYAHGRFGILHRDITPRNIIVDHAGHARLVDFGIAGAAGVIDSEALGSAGYMSPEQARRQALGPATDLFSLGAVLFEAATGRAAFEKTQRGALGPTPSLSERDAVPPALARIITSMLAHAPAERPASAAEVARQLRAFLAQAEPEGVLGEMRERAERARRARVSPAPEPAQPPPDATAKVEPRVIATSPVLTEMLRSAPGAQIPTRPITQRPAAPSTTQSLVGNEPRTRPIRDEAPSVTTPELEPKSAPEDTTDAAMTASMMRLWPWMAALTLAVAAALVMRARAPEARDEPRTNEHGRTSEPSAAHPVSSPVQAPTPLPPETTAKAPEPEAPTPASESPRSATVSIHATPWAEVSIDGKAQGTTPKRNLKLRAGAHVIRFRCPPLAREREVRFELLPDTSARISVDLSADPPRTFLDGAKEVR